MLLLNIDHQNNNDHPQSLTTSHPCHRNQVPLKHKHNNTQNNNYNVQTNVESVRC